MMQLRLSSELVLPERISGHAHAPEYVPKNCSGSSAVPLKYASRKIAFAV
jgi:hypothetical protein